MALEISLTEERRDAMVASGLWPNRLVTDYLDEVVRDAPTRMAIVAASADKGEITRLTYAALDRRVTRIAIGLAEAGVERGDVVSFQLPNWWQFCAVLLACMRIGAVANPLVTIFRQRELRFMLNFAQSRVVIAPSRFRDFDHGAMMADLAPQVPSLRRVLLIGGEGERSFETQLLDRAWEAERDARALFDARRPLPDEAVQLMYTSGTTGEPKGVMHTSNTLIGAALSFGSCVGLSADDVVFEASPLGHQSGCLYAAVMAVLLKTKLVLQDVWNPGAAGALIKDERATYTFAATPFLADLTSAFEHEPDVLASMRRFVCAGAPIPSALVERAIDRVGISVLSGWGMTENGIVTVARPGDAPEKVFGTDGKAIPGMEVRVVDNDKRPVAHGVVGNLQARGVGTFVGYLKKPELNATDAQGWFDTGDLARMDGDGYIRITGRTKDVIIRGGENIPAVEVENVMFRHPHVDAVAVIAIPDARLGERACAVVVTKPGRTLTLPEVTRFLESEGVAKQYWPERLEVVAEMPRTPSGKIQKFRLREMMAARA